MWIGYRDVEGGERDWRWSDGSNTTYTDWQTGSYAQPDSYGGEDQDCATYHSNKWYDLSCSSTEVNAFLCKGEFIFAHILNNTFPHCPRQDSMFHLGAPGWHWGTAPVTGVH